MLLNSFAAERVEIGALSQVLIPARLLTSHGAWYQQAIFSHIFSRKRGDLDDWTDAWVIADRLRFGRLPESCQVDFRYLPLQRLTRFRYHLMQTITREKNYFLTNLFLKFNTLQQNEIFSDLFGATSEAVLDEFLSPDEIAARPLDDLIDFLMEKGRKYFTDPKATAEALKIAAHDAHKLKGKLLEPVNLILATSIETITGLTWRGNLKPIRLPLPKQETLICVTISPKPPT